VGIDGSYGNDCYANDGWSRYSYGIGYFHHFDDGPLNWAERNP